MEALQEIFEDGFRKISAERIENSVNFEQAIIFINKQQEKAIKDEKKLAQLRKNVCLSIFHSQTSVAYL